MYKPSPEHATLMTKIKYARDMLTAAQGAIDARRNGRPIPPRPDAPWSPFAGRLSDLFKGGAQ